MATDYFSVDANCPVSSDQRRLVLFSAVAIKSFFFIYLFLTEL